MLFWFITIGYDASSRLGGGGGGGGEGESGIPQALVPRDPNCDELWNERDATGW